MLAALVVLAGLKRGTPSHAAPSLPLARILAQGLGAARAQPRIWFAWLLQFGSFGDRVVLGTFLSLRLQQAWLERGFTWPKPLDRARLPFVAAMVAGLATALVVGVLLDRVDRVRIGTWPPWRSRPGLPGLRIHRRPHAQSPPCWPWPRC